MPISRTPPTSSGDQTGGEETLAEPMRVGYANPEGSSDISPPDRTPRRRPATRAKAETVVADKVSEAVTVTDAVVVEDTGGTNPLVEERVEERVEETITWEREIVAPQGGCAPIETSRFRTRAYAAQIRCASTVDTVAILAEGGVYAAAETLATQVVGGQMVLDDAAVTCELVDFYRRMTATADEFAMMLDRAKSLRAQLDGDTMNLVGGLCAVARWTGAGDAMAMGPSLEQLQYVADCRERLALTASEAGTNLIACFAPELAERLEECAALLNSDAVQSSYHVRGGLAELVPMLVGHPVDFGSFWELASGRQTLLLWAADLSGTDGDEKAAEPAKYVAEPEPPESVLVAALRCRFANNRLSGPATAPRGGSSALSQSGQKVLAQRSMGNWNWRW